MARTHKAPLCKTPLEVGVMTQTPYNIVVVLYPDVS